MGLFRSENKENATTRVQSARTPSPNPPRRHQMRLAIIAGLSAALAATPAFAVEGVPVQGTGVSVEVEGSGGIMITQGDCAKQGGKIARHANGKWYCDLPVASKLTGVRTPTLGPAGVAATPLCPAGESHMDFGRQDRFLDRPIRGRKRPHRLGQDSSRGTSCPTQYSYAIALLCPAAKPGCPGYKPPSN